MICISASIRFKEKILEVSNELKKLGIDHLLPVMDLPKELENIDLDSIELDQEIINHLRSV